MLRPKFFTTMKEYTRQLFMADLFAGITVGVVALPLAMAFGIASGVDPARGLFTAIVAGFIISFLGGSRVQIGGPTGAFIIIVAAIVERYGYDGLVYTTIIAGVLLIIFGLTRMGVLIKFIPFPVTTGFTTGIAVVIFSTQIKDLLGLQMGAVPADFIEKWWEFGRHITTVQPAAAGIGILTILTIVLVRRFFPRLPNMLIGMAVATGVAMLFQLDVATIGSRFGDLPRTLPAPNFPSFDVTKIRELVSPAFTVAILAAIESLLSATVADGMIGGRHRSNIELVAQGAANIASAIFGGIPATGAIARTATNVKSGAKTPVAGMIHAVTLALLLLLLAPLAKAIPLAALAGILVVVAYNMSELDRFIGLFKAPKSDLAVLLVTFLLTVLVDLTVAVQIGLALAGVLFIRRMSEIANVGVLSNELTEQEELAVDPNAIDKRDVPHGVEVFEIYGPFFFGAADKFKETAKSVFGTVRVVILRMRSVPAIDATGIHVLREFLHSTRRHDVQLILSGVHAQPVFALQRDGLWDEIGEENIFGHIDDALDRAHDILQLPRAPRPGPFVATVSREKTREEHGDTPAADGPASR